MAPRALSSLVLAIAILAGGAQASEPAVFDCVLDPSLTLKLGSPVASIIDKVEVDRGGLVTRGQVIAQLESAVETATVALGRAKAESTAEISAKQARLELTRLAYGRQMTLQERNVAATQKVDEARADNQMAEQDLALAQLNRRVADLDRPRARATLEQRAIRSPIDGVVVQRALGPGEYAHQDAHIITVAKIDPLNVETFLPVRYYGRIKTGDVANVRPDDPIGGDHPARVSVVDRVFDAASGTFGVRLELANPDHAIPAGLRCRVTFTVPDAPSPVAKPTSQTTR
jgi:RND family efflux transporter MFP subunit